MKAALPTTDRPSSTPASTRALFPSASASGTIPFLTQNREAGVRQNVVGIDFCIRKSLILPVPKRLGNVSNGSILALMAENMLEYAQKMAENARAGLAIERKRLQ